MTSPISTTAQTRAVLSSGVGLALEQAPILIVGDPGVPTTASNGYGVRAGLLASWLGGPGGSRAKRLVEPPGRSEPAKASMNACPAVCMVAWAFSNNRRSSDFSISMQTSARRSGSTNTLVPVKPE